MEYIIHFLKAASLVELVLVAAAIVLGLLLVLVGIFICLRAKSRLTIVAFIFATFLPLVLSIFAVGYRWNNDNRLYEMNEVRPGDAIYERYRRENQADYLVAVTVGLVSSAIPLLIGVAGLVVKRKPQNT